ncbi:hypothetical protein K4K50_008474, partial [Colletotrichum sp. SAR 10_71]
RSLRLSLLTLARGRKCCRRRPSLLWPRMSAMTSRSRSPGAARPRSVSWSEMQLMPSSLPILRLSPRLRPALRRTRLTNFTAMRLCARLGRLTEILTPSGKSWRVERILKLRRWTMRRRLSSVAWKDTDVSAVAKHGREESSD